jgi:signal transduction histidine kinase
MTIYDLIKTFFIFLSSFSIYLKLTSRPLFIIENTVIGVLYTATITSLSIWVFNITNEFYVLVIFIITSGFIFAKIYKADIIESISFSIISFAISYVLHIIATSIAGIFFVLLFNINVISFSSIIIITVLQSVFIWLFYKIKFKIILKRNVCLIGNIFAGLILIIYGVSREEGLSFKTFNLIIAGGILCAVGLFYWIKRESIMAYNSKIQALENAKLKEETKKEKESRQYYEKIVHNDGKKLPAYQEAVKSLIEKVDDPVVKEKAERILGELNEARSAVTSDVVREMAQGRILSPTRTELLDAVFSYYNKICVAKDIEFNLIVHRVPDSIKQSDLETLIANLLDNAIIACEHSSNSHKSIIVNLSDNGLSVMDSGIAFPREVLESLRKQRITTHADTGGKGIGFLTIFEIARACKASVVITENTSFKTVAVWFDGKGEYRVESQGVEIFS